MILQHDEVALAGPLHERFDDVPTPLALEVGSGSTTMVPRMSSSRLHLGSIERALLGASGEDERGRQPAKHASSCEPMNSEKIAEVFYYLHAQDRSCGTHELQLTPFSTRPSH
jgi:hypothetical protein